MNHTHRGRQCQVLFCHKSNQNLGKIRTINSCIDTRTRSLAISAYGLSRMPANLSRKTYDSQLEQVTRLLTSSFDTLWLRW